MAFVYYYYTFYNVTGCKNVSLVEGRAFSAAAGIFDLAFVLAGLLHCLFPLDEGMVLHTIPSSN